MHVAVLEYRSNFEHVYHVVHVKKGCPKKNCPEQMCKKKLLQTVLVQIGGMKGYKKAKLNHKRNEITISVSISTEQTFFFKKHLENRSVCYVQNVTNMH